jgi:vancomycin resistance protein YoaR
MTGRVKVGVAIAVSSLSVLAVGTALWVNRPFQSELGTYRTSLADRTEAQLHNIRQAIMVLDGVVIEPGETFSFNKTLGPRTPERGYREAPAFMERDLVKSVGGGICQVSSTVYNAAALSGLSIIERHPHTRRVTSVPSGRDATVWYGKADLRLKNTRPHSVRLAARIANESLSFAVMGRRIPDQAILLHTAPILVPQLGARAFQTVRTMTSAGKPVMQEVLSFDVYVN